jgi:hypothetical protein
MQIRGHVGASQRKQPRRPTRDQLAMLITAGQLMGGSNQADPVGFPAFVRRWLPAEQSQIRSVDLAGGDGQLE